MAEQEKGLAEPVDGGGVHDLNSILCSSGRNFLIRNNGEQVEVESLKGKKVGLYFSASWCGPCQQFTPDLVEAYNELLPKGDFEIVFVSGDKDDESFSGYFSKMPWVAIPFSDSETRDRLDGLFSVMGIPHLVILDDTGKVLTNDGVEIILEYGAEGYPFTEERIKQVKEQEEVARREQSLRSILVSGSRDYVIAADGKKVSVTEIEGKTVGLYFSLSTFPGCNTFTPKLIEVYEKLKEKGENFEIVMIPLDKDEESFKLALKSMPWFSLPIKDKSCRKLVLYFELSTLPTLVIIGPDGKTLHSNVVDTIEEHSIQAYPFTPEKFAELEEIEKAKREAQTLESILIFGDKDFVIGKDGAKIQVSDLVGKNILLYFSAQWCPPCRAFLPKLIEAYHQIKAKDDSFEVIFISSDRDQNSFDEFFKMMPWLAVPFGDERKQLLARTFKVQGIPMAVAIGPTGKTLHSNVVDTIKEHGIQAYPFTPERFAELEEIEKAKREAQTLESILIFGDKDFVIGKDGAKIQVSDLVGKNILLYFSAQWCPPCRAFLPKLIEAYHKIKAKDDSFEVIFISSDRDQNSFDEFFKMMPWLAVPFGDERKQFLARTFKVQGIPMAVAIGPTGKTVTTEARDLLMYHGADAYPFTDERMKEIEAQQNETEKCALQENKEIGGDTDAGVADQEPKEGWICDGDVCRKA